MPRRLLSERSVPQTSLLLERPIGRSRVARRTPENGVFPGRPSPSKTELLQLSQTLPDGLLRSGLEKVRPQQTLVALSPGLAGNPSLRLPSRYTHRIETLQWKKRKRLIGGGAFQLPLKEQNPKGIWRDPLGGIDLVFAVRTVRLEIIRCCDVGHGPNGQRSQC